MKYYKKNKLCVTLLFMTIQFCYDEIIKKNESPCSKHLILVELPVALINTFVPLGFTKKKKKNYYLKVVVNFPCFL